MSSIELIHLINQQNHRSLSPHQVGQAVDLMYQLEYFYNAAQIFGRQYLVMIVDYKMMESYFLRKNKQLIDSKHFYVLIQGRVDKSGFSSGAEINIERDGAIHTLQDCIFLRMLVYSNSKKYQKLKNFQQQKIVKNGALNTKLQHDEQKLITIPKLQQIAIFGKLSKADFNLLAYKCTLKNLLKGKVTHQFNTQVQSLIYIIDGQIKISLPFEIQEQNKNLDSFLEKYLVNQGTKKSKHQVNANYGKADWIGMQQHEDSILSKSFGVVMSVQAKVLYIPVQIFDKLYNIKVNHAVFNKIKYLRKIKAELLQNSSKAQKKKESELLRWSQEKASLSPELRKKISKYQLDENAEELVKNPQSQKDLWNKRQSSIPTKVVHIVKSQNNTKTHQKTQTQQKSINFFEQSKYPQVERVNLFPQEYEQQFIYPNEMRQIKQAEYKKNINLMMYISPKHHRKACRSNKSSMNKPLNIEGEVSLEKSFFSMSKKVSEGFAMSSTFYRNYMSKGDDQTNLNLKTINSLEASRRDLLVRRKMQMHQQMNRKQSGSLMLPGLRRRAIINNFQPMNIHNEGKTMDLSHPISRQKYNIDQNNSLDLRSKESNHTIEMSKSSSKMGDLKQYSRTLFVNKQKMEKSIMREIKSRQSSLIRRDKSMLSIQ